VRRRVSYADAHCDSYTHTNCYACRHSNSNSNGDGRGKRDRNRNCDANVYPQADANAANCANAQSATDAAAETIVSSIVS
jgi:hypothetical protein